MADRQGFLGNIAWWGQLLIMLVLVLGLWYLVDTFMLADVRVQTEKDMKEVEKLHQENTKLVQIGLQLDGYKKSYEHTLSELQMYRERLPEEVKISETLQDLQQIAQADTLIIRAFKPKPPQPKDFYKEKLVEVQVGSTYANLGKFFEDIANFKRIVRVSNVEIKKANPQTTNLSIESSFVLTTFYASEADVLSMSTEAKK